MAIRLTRDFEKLTMRINGGEEITLVDGENYQNFDLLRKAAGSDYENLNDDLMNGRHANGNDFTVIVWNEDGSTTAIAFHYEPRLWAVRDREAGNVIDIFATREEAEAALKEYEEDDKAEGIYTPDFYEIAEVEA